jgi:CHAD domain-containing protein
MSPRSDDPRGLVYFAERAFADISRSRARMLPPTVKRIRTAMRRVRAMCEVILQLDDAPVTRALRRDARDVMRALGPLRDLHVERALLEQLITDPLPPLFARAFTRALATERARARRAILAFDVHGFISRARMVQRRIAHIVDEHPAVVHIAWERLDACWPLLQSARMHLREQTPLHTLRIGLKRFRYVVESFLPSTHAQLGKLLKARQDLLGEIHDLDVAHTRLALRDVALAPPLRRRALARVRSRRQTRMRAFTKLASEGFLDPFFAALPSGQALVDAACARLAQELAPFVRSERASSRRTQACRVLHDAFVDDHILPLSARDAHLATLTARIADVHNTSESKALIQAAARALRARQAVPPLDARFLDDLVWVLRRACATDARSPKVTHARRRHATLAAIVQLVCTFDAFANGASVLQARIEGDALVVIIESDHANPLRAKDRRRFQATTGVSLVVARLFRDSTSSAGSRHTDAGFRARGAQRDPLAG